MVETIGAAVLSLSKSLRVQQMSPGKNTLPNMFLLVFLPLAYHHPTGVFVSQGAGRAAYHSGSDVSGK